MFEMEIFIFLLILVLSSINFINCAPSPKNGSILRKMPILPSENGVPSNIDHPPRSDKDCDLDFLTQRDCGQYEKCCKSKCAVGWQNYLAECVDDLEKDVVHECKCFGQLEPETVTDESTHDQSWKCGIPKPTSSRIIGGTAAAENQWPWQVNIEYNDFSFRHMCGGSLITDSHVLTAAHCIEDDMDVTNYRVTIGSNDLQDSDATRRTISFMETHPNFFHLDSIDKDFITFDAAILTLSEPVVFSNSIMPVCLPRDDIESGTNCTATGWGYTTPADFIEYSPRFLQEAQLPVIDLQVCNDSTTVDAIVDETMVCAYSPDGKSTCHGDSGGPLVCHPYGVWELHGITSWGDPYCSKDPSVFTRVVKLLPWLKEVLKNYPIF